MTRGPDVAGRSVTVMGLGLFGGGSTVARWLARAGARVTVTDLRREAELEPALRELAGLDLRFVLGEHRLEDFERADLVVANPAVPPSSLYLRAAAAAGVPVSSETALFLAACPARIAAITGTQGKSSTSSLLAQLAAAAGLRTHLGGNIGHSLLDETASMSAEDVVVLEVSSYQLEVLPPRGRIATPPPRVEAVAVVNVLADHLERHGSLEAYAAAKRRILELAGEAGGWAVLPAEDPRLAAWSEPGARRVDVRLERPTGRGLDLAGGRFRLDGEELGLADDLRLAGPFQRANTLVAIGIARLLGGDPERLAAAVPGLRGLPHRLEDLGTYRGHRVWDNGVSTTPDSTISALLALEPGATLLVGGKPKALELDELVRVARDRARRVVVFGAAASAFPAAFRAAGVETWGAPTVEGAVEEAFARMGPGEELLFSPACASFDAYLNFRERALAFRRALGSPAPHPVAT